MPGAGLTVAAFGKARPDRLALKPYRGKPAVRNFREGDGDVGIIRSPVRAIALPDCRLQLVGEGIVLRHVGRSVEHFGDARERAGLLVGDPRSR